MGPYAFQGFADMGNSFLKSYQGELDRLERQKAMERDRAWQDEQRNRQRQEWQRDDEFNRVVREESAPVEVDTQYSAEDVGPARAISVRGRQFDNRDQASEFAEQENSPTRRQMRAADRAMAIDPTRATKLRNDAMTSRAAELQLSKAEQEQADEIYNRNLMGFLRGGEDWWEGAQKFAEASFGAKTDAVLSPDGKKVTLFVIDAEGNRKATGTYDADERGMDDFLSKASKLSPTEKLASLKAVADRLREADEAEAAREQGFVDYERKKVIDRKYERTPAAPQGQLIQVIGPDGKPTYARAVGDKLVPVDMGGMAMPPKEPRAFDPKAYADTVASFVDAGLSPPAARIAADELFGRRPPAANGQDPSLQQANRDRAAGAAPSAPAAERRPPGQPSVSSSERLRGFYVDAPRQAPPQKSDEQVILDLQQYMKR